MTINQLFNLHHLGLSGSVSPGNRLKLSGWIPSWVGNVYATRLLEIQPHPTSLDLNQENCWSWRISETLNHILPILGVSVEHKHMCIVSQKLSDFERLTCKLIKHQSLFNGVTLDTLHKVIQLCGGLVWPLFPFFRVPLFENPIIVQLGPHTNLATPQKRF